MNICSLLILFFIGVFLLPPSLRVSCGLLSSSPPRDVSLIEQLCLSCGLAGTKRDESMLPEFRPDSCSLRGLLGFLESLSDMDAESSAESVKSFMLVPLLLSECFDPVSGLP